MKDLQPNSEVINRPDVIRALCRIIDVCFVTLTRVLKLIPQIMTALNGSRWPWSTATPQLPWPPSSQHRIVKRWVNEVQEAVKAKLSLTFFGSSSGDGYHGFGGSSSQPNRPQAIASSNYITQYHGLGLFYLIRQ